MSFERFFGHDIDFALAMHPFTWQHYTLIFLGILAVVTTLIFAKGIKNSSIEKRIKIIFVIWLLFLELTYHIHYWSYGMFSVPLHICSFGVSLSVILLITDNKKVFEILFFVGTLGGLFALFIPNTLGYTFYNMRYYHFIFLHMSITMVPVYYYKAYGYRVKRISILKTFALFMIILPLVVFVNYKFNRNYMFIGEKPKILANILPDWPYYIIIFLVCAILVSYLLYLISNFQYKKAYKRIKLIFE